MERVIELPLTEEESRLFRQSVEQVAKDIATL